MSIYNCAMLAEMESRIQSNMTQMRALAVGALAVTEFGRAEQVFQEIYARFQQLENDGLYDPSDPAGNARRVAAETYDGSDFWTMTMRGLGITVALTATQFNLVQSFFSLQQSLERIDAEQARRPGCGG